MARIDMAGIDPSSDFSTSGTGLSRQQFATIAWLRWRIFVNSLRSKGATGELVVKILSYPFLAIIIFGPAVGATFAAYYFVSKGIDSFLAIPLWIIFALWQFIGVSTSATGPSFDLSTLIRFPIRYRDYLLMRLSFGLMDPPTLAGLGCLFGMSIGIAIASLGLFPWAALALLVYAACNVLFSRMIYTWMERWMARRRTRELITGLILLGSLAIQFVSQYAQRLGTSAGQHKPLSPVMAKAAHILVSINWLLPPGLTATSIDHLHHRMPLIAVAALAGLLIYTTAFLLILHLRLHAQYLGENLSEAPSAAASKSKPRSSRMPLTVAPRSSSSFSILPATVAACFIKEVRYLLRSGPKLYVLIMPVFIVFLFSMRTAGINYAGFAQHGLRGVLFTYGCAYMQLILVSLHYNSLGNDSGGVQFYFIAPLRMRDVMLAKNLLTSAIFAIEVILIYATAAYLSKPAPADLTVATLAWSLFALLLNMAIGNIRSITSPKGIDPAKVRGQNVSGVSSLISLVVVGVSIGLGILVYLLCRYLQASLWIAAGIFSLLALVAFVVYVVVLRQLDDIALSHVEDLSRALSKAV
jgi:ABC-2 type transport system permease protein